MSRRFAVIALASAAVACSIPLTLAILAESLLWIVVSCILLAGFLIAFSLVSRCPHCRRITRMDFFNLSYIYCTYCGGKVDLDENILHREE